MRWVVRIEREDDGSESDAIRIERSRMEDAAGLGLTLEDGKRIMALLQKRVLADQLREHCRSSRLCKEQDAENARREQQGAREQRLEAQKKKFEDELREENGPRARALRDRIHRVVKDAATRVDGGRHRQICAPAHRS
jgi:hypothetical protein